MRRNLVTKIAVNILITVPMSKVFAKPIIVPEPKYQSTIAAIIVVMFASIIAENALLKPAETDERRLLLF